MLVIGLGVGIGAVHFASKGLNVDIVGELGSLRDELTAEYDPAVVAAAQEYFGLADAGIRSVSVQDGVAYVAERAERALRGREQSPDPSGGAEKYDFIVHDVFSAGSLYPALFTTGFWENTRAIMKSDGVVVMVGIPQL